MSMVTYATDSDRFTFMRDVLSRTSGLALNVGCHSDGAGLRRMAPDRVLNCDVAVQPGYSYHVDRFFDARETWPFEDGEVEIVFLCDILEHLYDDEIVSALREARRVSWKLCVTVPHDELLRDEIDPSAAYKAHCNTIDEASIKRLLARGGWTPIEFHTIK